MDSNGCFLGTSPLPLRPQNYNQSRTHSLRGVRRVRVLLDGEAIFLGEVARADGSLQDAERKAEVRTVVDPRPIGKLLGEP